MRNFETGQTPRDPNIEQDKEEWLEAIKDIFDVYGSEGVCEILTSLNRWCGNNGVPIESQSANTAYLNTVSKKEQPIYPGNLELERRLENIIRWNAMAMVLQGQDAGTGVGGHIATYASAATLMEVGFNHFFRNKSEHYGGDLVILQPHTSPGIYARSWLEERLTTAQLKNFRRELQPEGGLTSYPHPRSMPDYWQVPNASMGLSTPIAIYQARFSRYLENRGLKPALGGKVWCFIGDGETDEPEVLGTINIASREKLDNLILVINCNLQRLDGPVRGNGKIIQELEASFTGAGWHVLKVIWGGGWDKLLEKDDRGILRKRMEDCVDGDYQRYSILPGQLQREHWVRGNQELQKMMDSLTDEELLKIKRGGQDPEKIYAAYARAVANTDKPTVILIKTVKGDGLVEAAGSNTVHQRKNFDASQRKEIAKNFGIPLSDAEIARAEFYRPDVAGEEIKYLNDRRKALGGPIPKRETNCIKLSPPPLDQFSSLLSSSRSRPQSTTMALVRILSILLKDETLGKYVVPIVPDEARTFGLESLFKIAGIFAMEGQHYTPVDEGTLVAYREAKDGQILQEGICETGAIASFIAAGTAYSIYGLPMIPFYFFYSIFGFQRVGDLIWSCGDMLCRGFLIGGTAGRTTLNGEGIQHQDGHSQVIANTYPNLKSYDAAFGFELTIIVREGIRRMYTQQENIFYYLTTYNETYEMPSMPDQEHITEGIIKGGYCYYSSDQIINSQIHLLGSGSIIQQVLLAKDHLEELGYLVSVWSITSYNELYRDAEACERHARLHPGSESKTSFLESLFAGSSGVYVAASDYMKSLARSIAPWMPENYQVLGTDGYGLSESREELRNYFEVDARHICHTALVGLLRDGKGNRRRIISQLANLKIDVEKPDPAEY